MKVAFLIHSLEVNSCRYRVLQYLPYLKEQGVDVSIHFFQRKWKGKIKFYSTLNHYDILYIHRKLFPPIEFWTIRKKVPKIIYDFDDAVMYRSSGALSPYSRSRRMKFAYMMRRVDGVVSGNRFLESEVLPYNNSVEVIPTSIDLSRYHLKECYFKGNPVTLGWLGSGSTVKYIRSLLPTLERVSLKYPHIQLKIVCDEFPESSRVPLVKKKWSADEEEADLKSFDIGLMPLTNDLWSKGKCGLKILQYFSVGVPAVCTPIGVNRDIVEDGVNGFWAENEDQWEDRLLEMIQEKGSWKEMGLKGRERVERGYSLTVNAPRLLNVLKKVLRSEGRSG